MDFFQFNDNKKIGMMLVGVGSLFFFAGVLLLLDRGLMALGNILFLR